VKIRLIEVEGELRPGMSCNVEIQTATRTNVLSVPLQSVTSREGELKTDILEDNDNDNLKVQKEKKSIGAKIPNTIIFVKDGDKAKVKEIVIGISNIGYVEVLSGLDEGEVIISGSYQAVSKLLADGSKIKEENVTNK
jgi:HlyD family secretion protein